MNEHAALLCLILIIAVMVIAGVAFFYVNSGLGDCDE